MDNDMSHVVDTLKNILNNSNSNDTNSSSSNNSNINSSSEPNTSKVENASQNVSISPEMISSLTNMLNNSNTNNSNSQNNSSNFSISPEMMNAFSNILQNSNNNNSETNNPNNNTNTNSKNSTTNTNNSNNSENNGFNIDFQTILKFKSIMDNLNSKDDPRANLLYSLKPYLRENRQKKLDQYVNLFSITKVANLFKNDNKEKDK